MGSEIEEFDYLFKVLVIGDSNTGKSSLIHNYKYKKYERPNPTFDNFLSLDSIVVHCTFQDVTMNGKKVKLAIWDTAGLERFRPLVAPYFRGALGIIMVYDVTRRNTFTNLSDVWATEIDLYSTDEDCIKMLVANKTDQEANRTVSKKEGMEFAKEHGCLYIECSAVTGENVQQCFEEVVAKILLSRKEVRKNIFKDKKPKSSGCCQIS